METEDDPEGGEGHDAFLVMVVSELVGGWTPRGIEGREDRIWMRSKFGIRELLESETRMGLGFVGHLLETHREEMKPAPLVGMDPH